MGQYGEAAVKAATLVQNKGVHPSEAWKEAISEISPSLLSQKKGCPKNAFLGLCEEGEIKGIPSGCYTQSEENKAYTLNALSQLRKCPDLCANPNLLWDRVKSGEDLSHNGQMDVVISLFEGGFTK